jgi:tetratricopeptide (TPR) repeat protein
MWVFSSIGKRSRIAQRSFVLGERSLRAYLAGGNVRFLKDAEANLSLIGPDTKQYQTARYYLGITKAQLRKSGESIEILQKLRESISNKSQEPEYDFSFADRIDLQLAYAQIKTYRDEGFVAAEQALNALRSSAKLHNSSEFLLQVKALQAFLYSVMAGRSKRREEKPHFISAAISVGSEVVKDPDASQAVRFEALNALGIAWMRFGEYCALNRKNETKIGFDWSMFDPSFFSTGQDLASQERAGWAEAQAYFDQALEITPNSVRVLQNMATLRLLQVENGVLSDRTDVLEEAKKFVKRSLEVNDQDQFPYSQLARIALLENDPKSALECIRQGRSRPGAVKEERWIELEQKAIALIISPSKGASSS